MSRALAALGALSLAPWVAPGEGVRIVSDFPGGNIVLEKIAGDEIYLHQDLRDTRGDWFYWYFAARGAQGRELTFHFTKSKAIGLLGRGVSRDGGMSWQWLGRADSPASFRYKFAPGETDVRFSFGMPYQHADLLRFLEKHKQSAHLKWEVLGRTRKGTPVELLRIGCVGAAPAHKVLVTVRHHACEMMASYVAEGLMEAFLGESEPSLWLQEHVECAVVPMVDKDGVENGDQGKNRLPHDHKADCGGPSIYPEVAALRAFVAKWTGGKPAVTLDLHNPSMNARAIYTHALRTPAGAPTGENAHVLEKRFLDALERCQRGPLRFRVQDSVDFAEKMARKASDEGQDATDAPVSANEESMGRAEKTPAHREISIGFEIPYALVGEVPVTPDSAREFGSDIARTLAAYLKTYDSCAPVSRLLDSDFEAVPPGELATTGRGAGWEIQRKGRPAIQPQLKVACLDDPARAKSGAKCLALSIPKDTVGFEFVTVGQRMALNEGREYEASAWVRWPDGPDAAPTNTGPTAGHRSAIVSFWARHRDGTGTFAGRDDWLFDNRWHRLSFRFRATDPGQRTLVYVSLLPNQEPAETTVLLDDLELNEFSDPTENESRQGSIALDADFSKQAAGTISPPWHFADRGGSGITGKVVESGDGRILTLAMGPATSNFESAQVWQHVELREGARYEVSCRMRWDNFAPGAPAPIVNYGIYHEVTHTWYGPVDQVLEKTGEWRAYRFTDIPPFSGRWRLYVQLNGWGNFGNGVTVSFDDFMCTRSP